MNFTDAVVELLEDHWKTGALTHRAAVLVLCKKSETNEAAGRAVWHYLHAWQNARYHMESSLDEGETLSVAMEVASQCDVQQDIISSIVDALATSGDLRIQAFARKTNAQITGEHIVRMARNYREEIDEPNAEHEAQLRRLAQKFASPHEQDIVEECIRQLRKKPNWKKDTRSLA